MWSQAGGLERTVARLPESQLHLLEQEYPNQTLNCVGHLHHLPKEDIALWEPRLRGDCGTGIGGIAAGRGSHRNDPYAVAKDE